MARLVAFAVLTLLTLGCVDARLSAPLAVDDPSSKHVESVFEMSGALLADDGERVWCIRAHLPLLSRTPLVPVSIGVVVWFPRGCRAQCHLSITRCTCSVVAWMYLRCADCCLNGNCCHGVCGCRHDCSDSFYAALQ